jgi:hypothetical protein
MSETLAVTIGVRRSDGSVEQVKIGTATRKGETFVLQFDSMSIGGVVAAPMAAPRAVSSGGGASSGMLLPNYGRSKGMPVSGASLQDLEFYANGARRSLADPTKARWAEKETQLLAAIEAEIAAQRGGTSSSAPSDDDIPPPSDEDAPF